MSAQLNENNGWRAELDLRFAYDGSRTVLASRKHIGPLVVQRPFYPEGDVCHVYIVHPPGGIVGGDRLRLRAALEPNAHTLITTPASTKFYRSSPERRGVLNQELHVCGATLEWLPQESIAFRSAHSTMQTRIHLDRNSKFIGWEFTCYGRPASDEKFSDGDLRQSFELWLEDRPLLLDRLHVDGRGAALGAPWGFANNTMLGTLLAFPATIDDLDAMREHESFACTLVDGVLSCRLLSSDTDAAKRAFVKLWQALRPRIVSRPAISPRIWAT